MPATNHADGSGFRRRATKLALIGGFVALAVGVIAAHRDPASGYEVSIYAATPATFRAGVVGAICVAVLGTLVAPRSRERYLSLLLGGLGVAAFAGIPLLRSYRFHGRADSLTHLGWSRALSSGLLDPFNFLYPATHAISVSISSVSGIRVSRAMLLVVWLVAIVYLTFAPLCAGIIASDRRALAVGGVSVLALLPINTISTYLHFHTYTLTTLFFPFFLYLLLTHTTRRHGSVLPRSLAPTSLALPLVSLALVVFHPQVALNVLILVGAFAATQAAHGLLSSTPDRNRRLYAQFAILGLCFAVWTFRFGAALDLLSVLRRTVVAFLTGTSTPGTAQHQMQSASQLGASLPELFVNLFLVGTVYSLLSAGLVGDRALDYLPFTDGTPDPNGTVRYLGVAGAVLTVFFFAHLIGVASYFFRHVGFAMVIATIVGSVAIARLSRRLESRVGAVDRDRLRAGLWTTVQVTVVVLAVSGLVLSLASVYPSPRLYRSSQHVTDAQMEGYGAAFDYTVEGAGLAGIASGPTRFSDTYHERIDGRLAWPFLGEELAGDTTNYTRGDYFTRSFYYLFVSEADYEREVTAYRELRVTREQLRAVGSEPGVSRVYDNGGLHLYHVEQPASVLDRSDRATDEGNQSSTDARAPIASLHAGGR